ncbi:MAG: helix-hairpin-helix domain-containing protein [Candidatus Omnitrophica bacterium]|nr:helix-hairpin-helix domain-containing protein [Candidatus Omnitrophota bacterium]
MISAIKGKLARKDQGSILVDAGALTYEVLVPLTVAQELKDVPIGGEVHLVTFHYYMGEPSKSYPVLIGFMNDIEREFFEKFITVSGVGPKAAVRAINKPISEIAKAIDRSDLAYLKSLPGIGEQRAKEIIAKLQNKIGKFALIKDVSGAGEGICTKQDITAEAVQVLMQLQYKRHQAQEMVEQAVKRNPKASTSEEILNEVYRQRGQ